MSNEDRDLEALLRQALRERADMVQPAGDGLAKIQERAARRRRRMAWLRPGIAAVAAALAVLAAVGIPALLNRSGPSGQDAASQGMASHSAASPRAKATPRVTTPKTAAPTPSAQRPDATKPTVGPNRVAGVPLWPYRNSTDAVASAGTNSDLTDPAQLAVKFVHAFVSIDAQITSEPPVEKGKIATVQIVRSDLGQRPVCTVELQRVATNSDAYVVTAAQTDKLTMKPVGPVEGSTSVTVAGTLEPDPSTTAMTNTLYSGVLLPNGSTSDKRLAAQPTDLNAQNRTWSVKVNTPERIAQPGIVAAWTVDLSGDVLDFAAQPAR